MANRHLARSVVLQTLFEWDFRGRDMSTIADVFERNLEEFASGINDTGFMRELLMSVIEKMQTLDTLIEKAAPDWPLDKISIVDRNILRIGLFELLFADRKQVPAKVAINEAIELAKTYGGETSGRFVNGVLGAVYKEIGEPGKEETSKKKIANSDLPDHMLPVEKLGGAVVYAKDGADIYLGLVHDIFGHWTLSKGHIEAGEDEKDATAREIKKELGLNVKIVEKLGENEYIAYDPEKGKRKKHVFYFLAESEFTDIKLEKEKGGLDDAKWFKLADILELNFYNDILPIVTKAIKHLLGETAKEGTPAK